MKEILFNPFRKIAGGKALVIGLLIMSATALLAYLTHCHFDGVIDAHIGSESPLYVYFIEALINWLLLTFVFFIVAKIISPSAVRFIDFAGTIALARYPYFFVAIIAMAMPEVNIEDFLDIENFDFTKLGLLTVLGLLMMLCTVWFIALLWNAFKISANGKGAKAVWAFVSALIFAEIISLIIFRLLLKF